MLRVGLTGSIAVGKSYVSAVLVELGCHVLDADQVARRVVEPGSAGLAEVVRHFGEEVLRGDRSLDRAALGAVVFRDPEKRTLLNSILHPLIIAAQDEEMRRAESEDPGGVFVVDAALMIESGGYRRFDRIIVVHCRPEIQLARLMERDRLTRAEAESRIAAQMPQEEKKRYADYLIETSDGHAATKQQTAAVYQELQQIALKLKT